MTVKSNEGGRKIAVQKEKCVNVSSDTTLKAAVILVRQEPLYGAQQED